MTRGELRDKLRREIQDVPGVQWDDAELNDRLNEAYFLVQKEIRKFFPEAHIFWDTMDIEAGTNWYPLPETFGIIQVGVKFSSSDTQYTNIKPKRYRDIGPVTHWSGGVQVTGSSGTSGTYYTQRGQWIGIFPTPTTTVVDGLELVHTPVMSMSDDTEYPRIKTPLHPAIVWWAKLLLLGETDENAESTRMRLGELINDLPLWYDGNFDQAEKIIPDIV